MTPFTFHRGCHSAIPLPQRHGIHVLHTRGTMTAQEVINYGRRVMNGHNFKVFSNDDTLFTGFRLGCVDYAERLGFPDEWIPQELIKVVYHVEPAFASEHGLDPVITIQVHANGALSEWPKGMADANLRAIRELMSVRCQRPEQPK